MASARPPWRLPAERGEKTAGLISDRDESAAEIRYCGQNIFVTTCSWTHLPALEAPRRRSWAAELHLHHSGPAATASKLFWPTPP